MRVDLFDFELPEERIALRPAEPRDAARLLVVGEMLADRVVSDLPDLLEPGDLLVFNDTKVIPARLRGVRRRGDSAVAIEAMLHMRAGPDRWRAFLRPGKRVKVGESIDFAGFSGRAEEKGDGGDALLVFDRAGAELDAAIAASGELPLPPYIAAKRGEDARDRTDYQTVYARAEGAVAAPTAGLHFTDRLFDRLASRGVERAFVTLHVGAGTFLPVKADDTDDHAMHAERGAVSEEAARAYNEARARGARVISVGTTSLRLLESAADGEGRLTAWAGATSIFITPGYRFKTADMLLTNFHLPRSTLFMLVSAFSGLARMRDAYAHAVGEGYRFYSYGDASLLRRAGAA